jgi:aryl-alcohol dehydrogenase-like predicted oxidoreductase
MKKIKRREFLCTAAAGAAGVLAAGTLVRAEPEKPAAKVDADPAALVPLGKHLKVCRMGAGTGMNGGNRQTNQTRLGKEKFEALLNYEYDRGIRAFDCADLYGTHPYVGRVLKGKPRESFQVFSKLWCLRGGLPEPERPDADVNVKRFLKELQMDYIDLVQIHCMTSPKWTQDMRKQMDIMAKLKEQGLIKAHGVSVHSFDALKAAADEPWVDVIHVRINPFKMRTDAAMDQVVPVVKKAHDAGKGIIGMKLVGEGQFDAQRREESINWVLGLGCVDCLVVGYEKTGQVDEIKSLVRKKLMAMARQREAAIV